MNNQNENEQSERREYKRIKKHFILTYYDGNDPSVKYSASQLKDISLGGMRLITAKLFEPQKRLVIELKTPFVSELIHLEGLVLESYEEVKDIIFITRLQFNNLSPQAEYVLGKIMEYLNKSENN